MLKHLIPLCLLLILSANIKAQKITKSGYSENPFNNLQFNYGPTDTVTLLARYAGVYGKLSEKNISALEVIQKINGPNIKKFRYAMGFTVNGYPQKFYMPSLDNGFYNMLLAKQSPKALRLKCVVYRFYTIDGITNFFYIDKVDVADERN